MPLLRSLSLLGALLFLLAPVPALRGQTQEPTVEAMLKEAKEHAKEEARQLSREVAQCLQQFRTRGNAAPAIHAAARDKLIELGFGTIPFLVDAIRKEKNDKILTRIAYALAGMHKAKKASTEDIALPLRELIDAENPLHAATAIAVLGAIGDEASKDAIRLQRSAKDTRVQAAVLVALARLGDLTCIPLLEDAARGTDGDLRLAAAQAYGFIGRNPQDHKTMLALAKDQDARVALAGLRALARLSSNSKAMALLHETLRHPNESFVRTAITVIESINKKDYSGRHLLALIKNTAASWELRKTAAQALFRMGESAGMMELTRGFRSEIKRRPRAAKPYEALAQFYEEFGAWPLAARAYEKAIARTNSGGQQNRWRLEIARCWAREGNFKKAASALKKTGRGTGWRDLANDPAFEAMRRDRRYGKNFGVTPR